MTLFIVRAGFTRAQFSLAKEEEISRKRRK